RAGSLGQRHIETKRRKFRTFTRDLKQLRAWLKNCQVTEIAMESTGQYWRPLWNLVEGGFAKVILVNPQHIKGLNGYKTDPNDAQWIADLLDHSTQFACIAARSQVCQCIILYR